MWLLYSLPFGLLLLLAWRGLSAPDFSPYQSLLLPATESSRQLAEGELRLRYFGASTVYVESGNTRLMIDGFFSRPAWWQLLFSRIAPDEQRIRDSLARGGIEQLDWIAMAHSHHDHALDTAQVAQLTGAQVAASRSGAQILRGGGLDESRIQTIPAEGAALAFEGIRLRIFPWPHTPQPLFTGEIHSPVTPPAHVRHYRMGDSFAFHLDTGSLRLLILSSANLHPAPPEDLQADVVLLCIAQLGKQEASFVEEYWQQAVRTTGAQLVIPIHWEDFSRPLSDPPRPLPFIADDLRHSMRQLKRLAERDQVALRLLPFFDTVDLPVDGMR